MKNKKSILIISAFIIFVSIIGIYFSRKNENVKPTFNNFTLTINEVDLMNNKSESFDELKLSLKEKYANQFISIFNEIKRDFDDFLNIALGEEFCNLKIEIDELNKRIFEHRKSFNDSDEYCQRKTKLKEIKEKLDVEEDEEKVIALQNELKQTLSEISTLNVKLENQLKDLKEEIKSKRIKANEISTQKKEEICSKMEDLSNVAKEKIVELVNGYNVELKELCEVYGEKYDSRELPIDLRLIKVPLPRFDKQGKMYIVDDDNVFSENDTTYIN